MIYVVAELLSQHPNYFPTYLVFSNISCGKKPTTGDEHPQFTSTFIQITVQLPVQLHSCYPMKYAKSHLHLHSHSHSANSHSHSAYSHSHSHSHPSYPHPHFFRSIQPDRVSMSNEFLNPYQISSTTTPDVTWGFPRRSKGEISPGCVRKRLIWRVFSDFFMKKLFLFAEICATHT